MKNQSNKQFVSKKLWPFLVSLGGASVMILAFFIPSVQDQWDRYQSRKIIEQYEQMGNDFMEESRFSMAEKSFQRAFDLSGEKRLDIEIRRLEAKVSAINNIPWGDKLPEGLEEVDFQFLFHFLAEKNQKEKHITLLNSYAVFLANKNRINEARVALTDALELDSIESMTWINLGNVYDQMSEPKDAEHSYLKAIKLDGSSALAHYNLGLLYRKENHFDKSRTEFLKAIQADPEDTDAKKELNQIDSLIKNAETN